MHSPLEQKPDYLVCICMGVMHSEVVTAIKDGATTFADLSDILGVGTGCNSCIEEVHDIVREELEK
ncbi:(2Fe-2S)-binding protein [bacterium]|jgi:bacterioferritin-associated ferredoxin|nr:(2Fe-2S)-binding protein [bacterium]MBT3903701.1 (2Fe-2S)-binding protein [bacterium]MBT4577462.1 (2Fe-2S)-binding protein [bacterium]MBT5345830.1 (2Fe-2S)-binding protein [bacterium]MBT6131282.1 (2Fe-2S)-binding protein [bacterium]